jgi:nucleoside 2-deoxyribosyltransferase
MQSCFVIMPFRPELAFFFLTIRTTIQQAFPNVVVQRGDDTVLTITILEKIVDFIRQADVIIADCSGRNPNVFYELGIAHALKKPVLLVTSDKIDEAPADIRAYDFISYERLLPDAFITRLTDALQKVLGNPFAEFYPKAAELFQQFCTTKERNITAVPQPEFEAAMVATNARGLRLPAGGRARDEYLIRRLLGSDPDIQVLVDLKDWLDAQYPGVPH